MLKHFIILIALSLFSVPMFAQQGVEKHRLIVLTDIENEPDDGESIVRLLLYSNVIDIEGIIATTSVHMKNLWFCYPEAGTYGKNHDVEGAENIRHVNVHAQKFPHPAQSIASSKSPTKAL